MTAPRQIVAGAIYLVTRRCAQREFLLKPSRTVNQVFLYVRRPDREFPPSTGASA